MNTCTAPDTCSACQTAKPPGWDSRFDYIRQDVGDTSTLYLVGCGARKLSTLAPAENLYTGPLFRAALRYAKAHPAGVAVLSALHGVLPLSRHTAPYDVSMASLGRSERAEWLTRVVAQLRYLAPPEERMRLVVLAGEPYVSPLRQYREWEVEAPLHGLTLGQRLRWFSQHNTETRQ